MPGATTTLRPSVMALDSVTTGYSSDPSDATTTDPSCEKRKTGTTQRRFRQLERKGEGEAGRGEEAGTLTEARKGGSGSSAETPLVRTRPSAPCNGTTRGEAWSASFLHSPSLLGSNGSSARRSSALASGGVGEDAVGSSGERQRWQ
jgi:hypothetical protein